MQAYSNPDRANDPHSLPDLEIFLSHLGTCDKCDNWIIANNPKDAVTMTCIACEGGMVTFTNSAWFWWNCFPGCLPDSDPIGPFAHAEQALANARDACLNDNDF